MPISYTEVENSELVRKATGYCVEEFVRCNIDEKAAEQLSLFGDYEFESCFLPKAYLTIADRIQNFHIRPDDVWVVINLDC